MAEIIEIADGYSITIPTHDVAWGVWVVTNPQNQSYSVDPHRDTCECRSHLDPRQPRECKHLRAVRKLAKLIWIERKSRTKSDFIYL